jgi:hypothetical protein
MFISCRLEDSDDESDDNATQYDAVTCTGRQPNSHVFVFGPNFQVADSGDIIPAEDQRFVWIDEILQKLHRPINPLPPLSDHSFNHLSKIVTGMRTLSGDNVVSGVYLIGELIISPAACTLLFCGYNIIMVIMV